MPKVFISGIEGFIGRHFKKHLETLGYDVDGCDIKTGLDVRDWFKRNETCDLFIHCAAIVGGREKIEGNPIEVATDLSIDAEMFNWAVRNKIPKVVYFSSSAAYPIGFQSEWARKVLKESDIDLEDIHNPDETYGLSKLVGEILAEKAKQAGVKVYVFRPFSGYGEDQDLTYPFPSFIKRVKERQDPFEIWGDGKQVRDWIHVDDIVEAVMEAIEQDIQEPINLGSGIPTSFNWLSEIMFEEVGWRPKEIKHRLDKPKGVQFRCSDNRKMLSFYQPKVTLKEGIQRSLWNKQR